MPLKGSRITGCLFYLNEARAGMNFYGKIFLKNLCHGMPALVAQKTRIPHPSVLILIWFILTLELQFLSGYFLIWLATGLVLVSTAFCAARFFQLLRRTRWILFSLVVIYSYTGQGTPLWPALGMLSPSIDGMADGFMQLLRLISVLSTLSILLNFLPQAQLVAGLYTLTRPFAFLGLSCERFAVRLALTLRYIEGARLASVSDWNEKAAQLISQQPETREKTTLQETMDLELEPLALYDLLVVAVFILLLAGAWL